MHDFIHTNGKCKVHNYMVQKYTKKTLALIKNSQILHNLFSYKNIQIYIRKDLQTFETNLYTKIHMRSRAISLTICPFGHGLFPMVDQCRSRSAGHLL